MVSIALHRLPIWVADVVSILVCDYLGWHKTYFLQKKRATACIFAKKVVPLQPN